MTFEEADKLLRILLANYAMPEPPTKERMQVFIQLLAPIDFETGKEAAMRVMSESEFFPKPAKILNVAKEIEASKSRAQYYVVRDRMQRELEASALPTVQGKRWLELLKNPKNWKGLSEEIKEAGFKGENPYVPKCPKCDSTENVFADSDQPSIKFICTSCNFCY